MFRHTFVKKKVMKKFILSSLVLTSLIVSSCRQEDEVLNQEDVTNLKIIRNHRDSKNNTTIKVDTLTVYQLKITSEPIKPPK